MIILGSLMTARPSVCDRLSLPQRIWEIGLPIGARRKGRKDRPGALSSRVRRTLLIPRKCSSAQVWGVAVVGSSSAGSREYKAPQC